MTIHEGFYCKTCGQYHAELSMETSAMKQTPQISPVLVSLLALSLSMSAHAAEKPIKTFILAGQSNMVG